MIKFNEININELSDKIIDEAYIKLLNNKYSFSILYYNHKTYILTKEKSFFIVDNIKKFINDAKEDIYYKTIITNQIKYNKKDLELFQYYLKKYKSKMMKTYGNKYLFGSIAVRTSDNAFITTIRGKEDFKDFTIVNKVDDYNHLIYVSNLKATLNAPLLNHLFKNEKVKAIIHINHEYDDNFPYLEYAIPGTVKDTIRNNQTSFNIKHHGLILMLDHKGNKI